MKSKKLFGKLISSVLAFALLVTATVGLSCTKASAAIPSKIFSDDKAVVVLNDDGTGSIIIKEGVSFTKSNPLTEVAGVQLKDIITFNDGGYVDKFYTEKQPQRRFEGKVINPYYSYVIKVEGCGPSGFFNGFGYIHFTDKTDDTYNLSIWSHDHGEHFVQYNSTNPTIVEITWNS